VTESIEVHAEEILFVDWNQNDDAPQTVSPEIMDIIGTHFPEGELIISMENTRALVIQCAADIQFHLESNIEGLDPENTNELVLKVLTTILGIHRVWKFIEKYYENHDTYADLV
jgi:hypothetical protein